MNKNRSKILALLDHIDPVDELERATTVQVRAWVLSGAGLYRGEAPNMPSPHLVSYFVLTDLARRQLLLVDHIKAGLWLPTGGHVEVDEDPADTVRRELAEELGPEVVQEAQVAAVPLFVTSTSTRGALSHIDVSLWYVVAADQSTPLNPDLREFRSVRWYGFDEVQDMAAARLDPQMHRFVRKLATSLDG